MRKKKADVFAETFYSKSQLQPEVVDTPFFTSPELEMDDFIPLRTRTTAKILKSLDESKATDEDHISATILK